ncbi:MAG: uracil-DNA glycosylase [Planctomycetota bacterium]|nr:MAG: uracil-DNA glycosylase [Planctomycetota bacterium]
MSLTRALQQVLHSWQSAGLDHWPRAAPLPQAAPEAESIDNASGAPESHVALPPAPSHSVESPELMARKSTAAARLELPVIAMAPEATQPGTREKRLAALAARVATCTRCQELASTRQKTVFGVGNPQARVMFIGEAPGADEDEQGEPFVGRAGQLLNKIITACGWTREEIYICNILRCRPPGNRLPEATEAHHCREYLNAQIAIVDPEFIVCWGTCASQNLLGSEETIGKMRGRFYTHGRAKVLCTYHPSYLLRNPEAKKPVWEDMKFLLGEMGLKVPE